MKHKRALLFYDQMEQILILYGDDDTKRKIEYVKNFLTENFGVDEFEDSYVEIERLHSKRLMWFLLSLIIDYETTKEKPKEQLSKPYGLGSSTSQKMKIPENIRMQEQFKKLADVLIIEQKSKSSLVRGILDEYLDGNKIRIDKQNQNKSYKNKKIDT